MFEDLKNKILKYKIGHDRLVSIGAVRTMFATKIAQSAAFAEDALYDEIISATDYLPAECGVPYRMKCIFNDIRRVPVCPVCGKECRVYDSNLSRHIPCFMSTCGNPSCIGSHMASHVKPSDGMRLAHSISMNRHKKAVRRSYISCIDSFTSGSFNTVGDDELIVFCKSRIAGQTGKNKIVFESDFVNTDMLCTLISKTIGMIPLPDGVDCESIKLSDLKLNERMYCIANSISKAPICKFCHAEPSSFINVKRGYTESCPKCQADKCREKKGLKTKSQIIASIPADKYELTHFPESVGADKLAVKCRKCGYVSEWRSGGGFMQRLAGRRLCKNCEIFESEKEREVYAFANSVYSGHILRNDRTAIAPQELDLYFPDIGSAIEFDGFYYHSDEAVKAGYHVLKTGRCETAGISLAHVFENEWTFRRFAVEGYIRHILAGGEYDRKDLSDFHINEISECEYRNFIAVNSPFDDYTHTGRLYGYFAGDRLLIAVNVKNRYRHEYDIVFSCTAVGEDIKFLTTNMVEKLGFALNATSVRLFVNRRYPIDFADPVKNISFAHNTRIRGWWYKAGNFRKEFALIPDNNVEAENMRAAGYRRIFDCGDAVFVWRPSGK